ncbi:NifU N-terminal domain-containing protein [Sporosarcina sp. FA9]|uniref:NifU N-terminal domain-containing protein n=1 Tax=Sporosarcina sp. FA9 TaxID=3413030 RepID=UPI003F65CDE3
MKILTIEPTPNPNSMRIVLETELPSGTSYNYTKADAETAAEPMSQVLNIPGINGIYHVMNFMAVEKTSDVEWAEILPQIQSIIPKV